MVCGGLRRFAVVCLLVILKSESYRSNNHYNAILSFTFCLKARKIKCDHNAVVYMFEEPR